MTIHRIHNDDTYLVYTIPTKEVLNKLGRSYPFHIDRSPVPYAGVWKEPLHLKFSTIPGETVHEVVPDLAMVGGRMFFNEKAHALLGRVVAQDGEFLPVTYDGGTGYIFNPLTIAEKSSAVDGKVTVFNEWGEVQNLGIIEEKLPAGTALFRCEATKYAGVFCTEEFRKAVEGAELKGLDFHPDLANIGAGAASGH